MLRSLLIKVPTLTVAALLLHRGAVAWAALTLGVGLALLLFQVMHPNAGLWTPVRWRSLRPRAAVALTFDDGPDPRFTPALLDLLRERRLRATFFVVGERAERYPELIRRIDQEGHLLGNHSHRHDLAIHFGLWKKAADEIDRCNEILARILKKTPRLFRPPLGFKNPALGDELRRRGMVVVGWQARGYDAVSADAGAIARRLLEGARPGGVLLLHDGAGLRGTEDRGPTLAALPLLLDGLQARGLAVVPLDELLQEQAYLP